MEQRDKVRPNALTYHAIIGALEGGGQWRQMVLLWERMLARAGPGRASHRWALPEFPAAGGKE